MNNSILCTDLDGPIINCEDRYYSVYRDIVRELEGNPLSKACFWKLKRDRITEKILLNKSKVAESYFDYYQLKKIEKIENIHYLNMDFLVPGIHHVLEEARNIFHKILLITLRRNKDALSIQLRQLDIARFFDRILTGFSDEIPAWKVKTNLFYSLGIDITPDNDGGYFIGDTEADILAGKEIGLKTVAVTSGIRTREILELYEPDLIVPDFTSFLTALSPRLGTRQ